MFSFAERVHYKITDILVIGIKNVVIMGNY